ncbi:MAG: ABC transporter permease [Chlamydiae bacterium]|nr:ABC transporter permease [Chlamydiota bacterium]
MIKRISALIIKELIALLKDKKSRFILILPPLVQLLIFSMAATLDVKNIAIGICNQDMGSYSIELQQRFTGAPVFSRVQHYENLKAAEQDLVMQKISGIIYFNNIFSKNIALGDPGNFLFILDGRKSNSAQIVLGYAQKIVDQYNQEITYDKKSSSIPAVLIQRNWFNPNLIYQWFTVPGLVAILAMTTSLTVTALSIAREKELGTFEQLLVSPLTPFEILIGKSIPGLLIGIFESTLILLAGIFVFQIPFTGSILSFYISLTIFIISIVGVGIFLSALSKTQQQALLNMFFFISPSVILSGFATPIANMPIWLQKITIINPLKYFLVISRGAFLKEMTLEEILQGSIPMLWIGLFTLTAAGLTFRKKIN